MTTGARVVLGLLLVSLFAGAVTGSQLYYRLGYVWVFLLVGSWIWSRVMLRGVQLRRRPRATRAQMGQIFEERFEIDNPGRMPRLWLSIKDESPLPGTQGSRLFPLVEGRRGRTYLARTRLLQRGVYPLGPSSLEAGDPFGLFPVSRHILADESLLVYPMLMEVSDFPNPAGIMPGGEALQRRTSQVTPNAAGVRDYYPGDPLNRIHWVSTARRGRLMAKEFELDPQAEVWIFLDASRIGQAALPYQPEIEESDDLWKRDVGFSLPDQLNLVSMTCDRGISPDTPFCEYSTLAAGETVVSTLVATPNQILRIERGMPSRLLLSLSKWIVHLTRIVPLTRLAVIIRHQSPSSWMGKCLIRDSRSTRLSLINS